LLLFADLIKNDRVGQNCLPGGENSAISTRATVGSNAASPDY